MKTKSLKTSIAASVVCILLCAAMLVGATYAWFTDGATNSGNVITTGTLKIDAFAYDTVDEAQENGTTVTLDGAVSGTFNFASEGQNLKTDPDPIINGVVIAPGDTEAYAKLVEVKNVGSLAAKVKLNFEITDSGLADALWFDFVGIDESGTVTGQIEKREMALIEQLGQAKEFDIGPEQNLRYVFIFGMNDPDTVGNEFQGKSFGLDVTVLATQNVVGAEYAEYNVDTNEEMQAAVLGGGSIKLQNDVTLEKYVVDSTEKSYLIAEDTEIDLGGNTLTVDETIYYTIVLAQDATLTFKNGNMKLKSTMGDNWGVTYFGVKEPGAELVFDNVDIECYNSLAVIENPGQTKITVKDSTIKCGNSTAISTNATKSYPCEIEIVDSTIECGEVFGNMIAWDTHDSCAVFMNVPGKLTVTRSTIIGERQGVLVRGGEAVITDSEIVMNGNYTGNYDQYLNGNWASGNEVPVGALIVGDRSNAYPYPASVTLVNTKVTSKNAQAPAVYIWGDSAEYYASLTYDKDCVLSTLEGGTLIAGYNQFASVNGVAGN